MRALVVDELGAPAYRATQIRDPLYGKRRDARVASMTLVPAALRDAMEASGVVTGRLDVVRRDLARDGTGKLAMRVGENEVVETVGIPDASCFSSRRRMTRSTARSHSGRSEDGIRIVYRRA